MLLIKKLIKYWNYKNINTIINWLHLSL